MYTQSSSWEVTLRIGYSYWGFLGDNKVDNGGAEISAPDGNATYSWSLIWEMQRRGHTVHLMQEDRDWPGWRRWGSGNFAAFSQEKRTEAYTKLLHTFGSSEILPELDVLLVEWRFPIVGRNCVQGPSPDKFLFMMNIQEGVIADGFQPDLFRQVQILNHYKGKKTKIIFWDLDHKVEKRDEEYWKPDAIFETSETPLELSMKRTRVEPPFIISDLLQHTTLPADPARKLVYIGSRYERDDIITKWIKPASDRYPNEVEFHGNWLKTADECRKLWPNVSYNDRCTVKDFRKIYGTAMACPLLAKKSYLESGFITPRVWEALLFGTLPVGLGTAKGIEQYVLDEMIVWDPDDLIHMMDWLPQDEEERRKMRESNVEKLEFMDARHFVDKVEGVVSTTQEKGRGTENGKKEDQVQDDGRNATTQVGGTGQAVRSEVADPGQSSA